MEGFAAFCHQPYQLVYFCLPAAPSPRCFNAGDPSTDSAQDRLLLRDFPEACSLSQATRMHTLATVRDLASAVPSA